MSKAARAILSRTDAKSVPVGNPLLPRKQKLQRKSENAGVEIQNNSAAPPIVHEVLRSPGQPLDPKTRGLMEARFGHDVSQVRVHAAAKGADSAQSVKALSYTVGQNVVFGHGAYQPQTALGKSSLAHELRGERVHKATMGKDEEIEAERCARPCGGTPGPTAECAGCGGKKSVFQRKLAIGASNDPLEQEADRIADQVLAAPAHPAANGAPPPIQRFSGQSTGQMDNTASASVDRALASPGRPLDTALREDMEHRFGHDFSRVRVHSDAAAEQSARDVNAHAYTAGDNIVFGTGRFAPGTHEGQRLLAHELTHVVQQATGLSTRIIQGSWDWGRAGLGALIGGVGGAVVGGLIGGPLGALVGAGIGAVAGGFIGGLTGASPATAKRITPTFILDKQEDPRSNTKPSTQSKSPPTFVGGVMADGKMWRYELKSVESKGKIRIVYFTENRYPAPTPTDDSGALSNVTRANWKTIVQDLEKNKEGIPDFWSAYRAEDVHESYHWEVEWQGEMKKELIKAENDIAGLSLGVDRAPTAADAENVLAPQATKVFTDAMNRADASYQALPDIPGAPAFKAQIPVVTALKKRVDDHAKTNKW
jgi:hypothetical protein